MAFVVAIAVAVAWGPAGARAWEFMAESEGQQSLEGLTRELAGRFSRVESVIPEELERLRSRPGGVVLLDVREKAEFAVAHLAGADWVAPDTTARDLARRLGSGVAGKTVVLYCSVGYRSSQVADRVRAALTALGALRVVNLAGGIFAWHNTGRPLVDGHGATIFVHPYDRKWGRYLDFDNLARMKAAE